MTKQGPFSADPGSPAGLRLGGRRRGELPAPGEYLYVNLNGESALGCFNTTGCPAAETPFFWDHTDFHVLCVGANFHVLRVGANDRFAP